MISNERQRKYINNKKERGERSISFYVEPIIFDALNDFKKKIRRPRSYTIKAIITNYLKKQGYQFGEAYSLDKPKKDVL